MVTQIHSTHINYLVWRYLTESGFMHAAFAMQNEAQINEHFPDVHPGELVTLLQKSLLYMQVETHLSLVTI